jgi:hypothetical protein
MKPINFKEHNAVYGEEQPEYIPLPVFVNDEDENGEVVSCWNLSFTERVRLQFTGKIWLSLLTFHKPLTPSILTTQKKKILKKISYERY